MKATIQIHAIQTQAAVLRLGLGAQWRDAAFNAPVTVLAYIYARAEGA